MLEWILASMVFFGCILLGAFVLYLDKKNSLRIEAELEVEKITFDEFNEWRVSQGMSKLPRNPVKRKT